MTFAQRIEINLNQTADEWTLAGELHSAAMGAVLGAALLFVFQILVF